MGMFDCPKHGLQEATWAYKHLSQQVNENNFSPYRKVGNTYLCIACYKRTAWHILANIPLVNMVARALTCKRPRITYGRCSECFKVAEYGAAKRAGLPLPFVGYERTLNWSRLAEVRKLEAVLQERFAFQPSRRPWNKSKSSLDITPGSFTEPLTIEIYYVTSPDEQAQILTSIADFFLTSDYPQRRVHFYEAERWHEEVHGNGRSSYHYLEGVLLREELVA